MAYAVGAVLVVGFLLAGVRGAELAGLGILAYVTSRKGRRVVAKRDTQRYFDAHQRRVLFAIARGRCQHCGVVLHYKTHCPTGDRCGSCFCADHRKAHAKGGRTRLSNGQALCWACNTAKGTKEGVTWWATITKSVGIGSSARPKSARSATPRPTKAPARSRPSTTRPARASGR